jgi:nitroreductase
MDLLSGIESRSSAAKLGEPGPTREHLEQILRAGARAPDHGRLRPWRFVVIEGGAREKLGAAMAGVARAKFPTATEAQLASERDKALRAPTIVIVAARITQGKIPEIEQVLSAGAAAQNMLLAAHALGYGAMWKTGGVAYDTNAKSLLGLSPEDHIVALLYLGTTVAPGVASQASTDGLVRWL